jgi:hypothetical protein
MTFLMKHNRAQKIRFARFTAILLAVLCKQWIACAHLSAQESQPLSASQIVHQMVQAESAAWKTRQHFLYRNHERSIRTDGRLWDEIVVETSDGSMQRLIAEDGKPLPDSQEQAEQQHINYLATHPVEFRRRSQRRQEDEARMPELLREIPNIFLFRTIDSQGDYFRIAFQSNPSFHEVSYQDRVIHAMSGNLLIHKTDMRLCKLDGHLDHKVEFGFGILGELSDQTRLFLERQEVSPGQWATTNIRVHLDGRILLLKSFSRDLDSSRSAFRLVPHDLTVSEAAAILRSSTF